MTAKNHDLLAGKNFNKFEQNLKKLTGLLSTIKPAS